MKKQAWAKTETGDVTLRHVAALAGVSRQAAGAILGERAHLFRDETQERVRSAAKQIGYRPNSAARAMLTRQTKQIGVLIRNNAEQPETYPHAYYTIMGANIALESAGYVLCLVRIGDVEHGMSGESRVFKEHVLDGIIVTTAIAPHLCDVVEELVPNCVWADTNVWRPTHCVRRDEMQAGIIAARAAQAAGYKKVFFLSNVDTPEKRHYSHSLREEGVKQVCQAAGMEFDVLKTEWFWHTNLIDVFTPFMRKDVVIITSDVARARLISKAAQSARLVPGEDFSLICCDSVPEVEYGWPDLARVDFNRFELGRVAAQMMLDVLRPTEAVDARPREEALRSTLLASPWCDGSTLVALG